MDQELESRVIHVEIHGQRYPIRSALEGQYVAELAALNIADAYFRVRDADHSWTSGLEDRARALERMVDLAIGLADPQNDGDQSHLDARLRLK